MKVGFDAKRAAQNRTGLGNYSRFVIDLLNDYAKEDECILYTPNPRKASLLKELHSGEPRTAFPTGVFCQKASSLWRIWGITNDLIRDGIQLFHGLSNELPLNISKAKELKSIVTIHDLIFLRYPEYYHFIDRKIYAYKFRKACLNADCIIAVSECTKRDIISFFHIPEEKIEVVYQGCDAQFKKAASTEMKEKIREKYQLPQQYILYLGSIEKRKNLLLLAKALKHLHHQIPVIAVGKRTPYTDEIEKYLTQNQLEGQMRMISNIPFAELPAFYQMATTFVYPSFFEGFGIPLLEALHSGVPAIGATGSCLEEAGGPHSIYIDPTNEVELAQAIDLTLVNEPLRQTMIREGKRYAERFEEDKLGKNLLQVYHKTMKK